MMQLDDKTVCKPLNETERRFYEQVPRELQQFVPRYEGTFDALLSEQAREAVHHREFDCKEIRTEDESQTTDCARWEDVDSTANVGVDGTIEIASRGINGHTCEHQKQIKASRSSGAIGNELYADSGEDSRNCFQSQRFLVLENIVSQFQKPCILDVKLGQRTHGDDASQLKIESQEAKCRNTTSSSLGIRICGMQVYDIATDSLRRWDKFYGRTITTDTIKKKGLWKFLKPALLLELDVISRFVDRLKEIMHAVEKQMTYRFYSSSLLLVYDYSGIKAVVDCGLHDWDECIDVRMIDFAHTTWAGANDSRVAEYSGPDEGYLFGLRNMIRLLQEIKTQSVLERDHSVGDTL